MDFTFSHSDFNSGERPIVKEINSERSSESPLKIKSAIMEQYWTDLVFIHWRYPVDVVQHLLPEGVEVETYDGDAWVGLIPFNMNDLGFPKLKPLPYVGSFPEVNVRTYVRCGGHSGVWFFSLDINKLLPTLIARVAYKIPYCYGKVNHVRNNNYLKTHVVRSWPESGPSSELTIKFGEKTDGDFERFLTARWGLISTNRKGKPIWAPVDHPPWSLRKAEIVTLEDELVSSTGLPAPSGSPHVMYSEGVPVRIGIPGKIRKF